MIHVVVTRWRVRDDLFLLVPLQVVNVAFVAAIGYIYHYHFLIVTLLALPFAAHVCDLLLASGRARAAAAAVAACVTVGVFAAFFRGKEDEFDYQDVVMRDADRLVAPGARVFAGVAYALRREPACRTWFITERAFVFERAGIAAPCDVAADPPGAVILDVPMRHWLAAHPRQAEFVRRHYRPVWPELWLPAMNARLTPERPSTRWVVPADGVWVVRASAPIRLTIDGNPQPQSGTLTLRKRQRLEAAAESMQPTDVLIVPAGAPRQFRRPAPGVTLDAIAPPRTHVPRLW